MKLLKKLHIPILLAVAFVSCQLAIAQSSTYLEGLKAFNMQDFPAAKEAFLKELSDNPGNDAACFYLANIAAIDHDDNLTEQHLKRALDLSPDNYWYKYNLALFYGNTDRMELTAALMEDLIAANPKKSSLYYDVINVYIALNDTDKALATLDKIEAGIGKNELIGLTRVDLLRKKPGADIDSIYGVLADYYKECKTPRIATILGDYYVQSFRDSLAMYYYDEATSLDPDYTPAYYGKAGINQMLRQYDDFFSNISHFIKDQGMDPGAKAQFVSSMMESPQFVRSFAREVDDMMVDLHNTHPQDSTINALLGSYYYNTNRSYLAIEILRQNAELYPESRSVGFDYLLILYYLQHWSMLENAATVMMDRFPEEPDIIQMRAIAFTNEKNAPAAIEDYLKILELKPRDTTVLTVSYSSLGTLYHDIGDSKNSSKYFEKALKINPDDLLTLNNYAYFLSLDGKKLKKAKEMSRKTIESEPDNPTYLDTYAWILHLMGDDVEAKALFKHAMLYGGKESATILNHYATVLEALGEKDLATIYRNQAEAMEKQ